MEHKTIKERLSNMSTKEKFSYLWYYYKNHLLISIAIVMVVISLITTIINNTDYYLKITLFAPYANTEKLNELSDKSTNSLVQNSEKEKIVFEYLTKTDNPMDTYTVASMQKFSTELGAKEIDILIIDKTDFDESIKNGMFNRLDTMEGFSSIDLSAHALIKYKGENDTEEGVYGIALDNFTLLKDASFDTKGKILGVIVNSERKDRIIPFLNWFFTQ